MAVSLVPTTKEYLYATIVAEEDISGSTVEVADMADEAIPTADDWVIPVDVARPNAQTAVAKILVETGRTEVTRTIWIAVGDHPERPVRRAGQYSVA